MPDYGPENYNCLAGCGSKYKVDPIWSRAPMEAVAESFAPVIKAKIGVAGNYITVGNESYPSNENRAVIKSIDMGFINSFEGSMEIIDEDGGALTVWMNSVEKCMSQIALQGKKMKIQIGWVYTTCEGTSGMVLSPEISTNLMGIETNLSNGLIRFVAKFTTADNIAEIARQDRTYGEQTNGKRMKLEEAITQIMAECPEMRVDFGYYDQKGELKRGANKLEWLENGIVKLGGPKSIWQADSQNRFNSIAKWVEGFRVKDGEKDKGIVLINDPSVPNTLLVLKDPNPEDMKIDADGSSGTSYGGRKHVGTFIVNGGKCSNVLEFNPSFNIANALSRLSSGGNTKGGLSTDNELKDTTKTPIEKKQCEASGGIQTTITLSQAIEDVAGKDAPSEVNKSQQAHIRANRIFDIQGLAISAELRIVGSTHPLFYSVEATGAPLSIVVITPFTIRGGKTGRECGDYLKKADCHEIFSNKKWIIEGVSHAIKEGSFVTTLKVALYGPIELEAGVPLGGDPDGAVLATC